ncbi:MAG: hypothetical protein ABSF92_09495 [Candidatus Acidiferrales bacterium]|jgi:predicted DNA-binding protein (UPF0251 family)
MQAKRSTPHSNLTSALEAIANLLLQELHEVFFDGQGIALSAHADIELAPVDQKGGAFYRHFLPLRKDLVTVLAVSYRRYFKPALAHPREAGRDPHQWAWDQLLPAVCAALEWIRNWYILACDVRPLVSTEFVPGQPLSISIPTTAPPLPSPKSWRAPAWLFSVAPTVGIGPLKTEHVPDTSSEQRLGAAHTRLLLKGARRVFLWELETAIDTVRNEEIAAAGAIPEATVGGQAGGPNKPPKHWLKGFEGLGPPKTDLSQYMHNLTEKQQLAASLKWEYGLGLAEIASRMGINRKTADEHIEAAKRKIDEALSSEKRKAHRAKSKPE